MFRFQHRLLSIFSEIKFLRLDKYKLRALIHLLDVHYRPVNAGALSIAFVSHARLTQMHAQFCGDRSPTDIITFPGADAETFGELCISPQAALDYVCKKNRRAPRAASSTISAAAAEELTRYVIHGYLHLIGYDDLNPKDKRQMRRQERTGLKLAAGVGLIFTLK